MDSSPFFRGMRVLFIGHGDCLSWFNCCQARGIVNLGFHPHVDVRLLAQPGASLKFLTSRARTIFQLRPHVMVVNLGMFDLFRHNCDPLVLAERYWHVLSLISSCMAGVSPSKVVVISQHRNPSHLAPDRLYADRVDAFHSRLFRLIEGSLNFSFLVIGDILDIWRLGVGLVGVSLRDITPSELPSHVALLVIKRHIAAVLSARSKYGFSFHLIFNNFRCLVHKFVSPNVCGNRLPNRL